ncbi:MAG: KipI antagonist [Verrucomicrobiota bacterium]|jgi:KipI family sensor histidine kinase inhibitor
MKLTPLGDSAVVLSSGECLDDAGFARMRTWAEAIAKAALSGVVDVFPAFGSVAVFYDVAHVVSYLHLGTELRAIAEACTQNAVFEPPRTIDIPVCYGGELGPDLSIVADHAHLPADEVIRLHSAADYQVHAIGFVPGFAYLGGLPRVLHTPRRATPRARVVAGSVGIGGSQTGVYPLATPGGWNLIGRSPLRLFDPASSPPTLLRAGDRVKFSPISTVEFARLTPAFPWDQGSVGSGSDRERRVTVLKPGMLTTVQDLGWRGQRNAGVPLGGAVDPFALRLANALVGNPENLAALECTLIGPQLRFEQEALVAFTGAQFGDWPQNQPLRVAAGEVFDFGAARHGCRGYLAVAGGIEVPAVMGSRSTYLRAELGGFRGRALREGDQLPMGNVDRHPAGRWHIDERITPAYSDEPVLRVVRGAQADEFGAEFYGARYRVSPQSDRMGVRLTGGALSRWAGQELISAPVAPGTVQIPPDGQPIVLTADAQTVGGYPQMAHVISVDLPLVAQLRPGNAVLFQEVTLAEAHERAIARERALALLREGLAAKFI